MEEIIKLLIGGSPCTFWSIAQKNNREVKPEGVGWLLLENFLIALIKFNPDYFLYENNKSMAKEIREQIDIEFNKKYVESVEWHLVKHETTNKGYCAKWFYQNMTTGETAQISRILINSSLVSAQNRLRLYWTNIPNVSQPEDRGIWLMDILESGKVYSEKGYTLRASYGHMSQRDFREHSKKRQYGAQGVFEPIGQTKEGKSYCLTASYYKVSPINFLRKKERTMVAEPVCVAQRGRYSDSGNRYKKTAGKISQYYEAREDRKTNALTTVGKDNLIAETIRVGNFEKKWQGNRIYSIHGKSIALCSQSGGTGSNTGLYAIPIRVGGLGSNAQAQRIYSIQGKSVTINAGGGGQGGKTGLYALPSISAEKPAYIVSEGQITIKDKQYPIKLKDGFYIIRKLTVTECKRLQTVCEDYIMSCSPSQNYKMLGNGWTVEVIKHILSYIPGIQNATVKVLSMYDGMSCGQIALTELGCSIKSYVSYEIDKYAIQTTQMNFPNTIQMGDAFQVRNSEWNYNK